MSDFIRRQDAIKAINDIFMEDESYKKWIRIAINNIPPIEPERTVGKWIETDVFENADDTIPEWQSAKCSACGRYHTTPYLYKFTEYPYCPNCGARMNWRKDE